MEITCPLKNQNGNMKKDVWEVTSMIWGPESLPFGNRLREVMYLREKFEGHNHTSSFKSRYLLILEWFPRHKGLTRLKSEKKNR